MKILARSLKGKEFLYAVRSSHAVPDAQAEKIQDALNAAGYNLNPGETWHIHDVGPYDNAYSYAKRQAFQIKNGNICRLAI